MQGRVHLGRVFCWLFFGAACAGGAQKNAPAEPGPRESAPLLALPLPRTPPLPAAERSRSIGTCDDEAARAPRHTFTLAHVNDMQARYGTRLAGKSRWAYVAGYLEQLKREVPETLVLDAGDDYEKGSIADLRSSGEATRQLLQLLPIDVRTIGNHDFAYGVPAVLRDVAGSKHPVLAANVAYEDGSSPFASFASFRVGCVNVGVVGVVTRNYGSDDQPTKEPYGGVLRHDARYAEVVGRVVAAHRSEVDVMVALDHVGLFDDATIASRVAGLDVVIGGHSEDRVKSPMPIYRQGGARAWLTQAGHYAEVVGRMDFGFVAEERRLVLVGSKMVEMAPGGPVDEDLDAHVRALEAAYAPEAQLPIGYLRSKVPAGHKMTELVFTAARRIWGIDALASGRDVYWDGLPAGPLTLQRLYDSVFVQRQPAGTSGFTSLYVVEVRGSELLRLSSRPWNGAFALHLPSKIEPSQTYRLALEKRLQQHPKMALLGGKPWPEARYAGELIDVLEAYVRERTRRGLSIDDDGG